MCRSSRLEAMAIRAASRADSASCAFPMAAWRRARSIYARQRNVKVAARRREATCAHHGGMLAAAARRRCRAIWRNGGAHEYIMCAARKPPGGSSVGGFARRWALGWRANGVMFSYDARISSASTSSAPIAGAHHGIFLSFFLAAVEK